MIGPVHIDLRDLTDEHLAEALPNLGACRYDAPCIIGTLIPTERRVGPLGGTASIGALGEDYLILPKDQLGLANRLQEAFDMGNRDKFLAQWELTKKALAA